MKPIWSGFIFFRLIIFGNGGVSVRHCCAKPWPGVGVVNFGRRALGFIRGCRWVLANTVALRFADLKGRRMGGETETRWRWGSSSFCFDFFGCPCYFCGEQSKLVHWYRWIDSGCRGIFLHGPLIPLTAQCLWLRHFVLTDLKWQVFLFFRFLAITPFSSSDQH